MKWIPCKDRLPELSDYYLVTTKDHRVKILFFDNYLRKGWLKEKSTDLETGVVAWMPLPEPY